MSEKEQMQESQNTPDQASEAQTPDQNFHPFDDETKTKKGFRWTPFVMYLSKHRKKIYLAYVLIGFLLLYLMVTKPALEDPYLMEIFRR